mgnify:FL=1
MLFMWFKLQKVEARAFQAEQIVRKQVISKDSLKKISDGYYQKLVADTLTSKQLTDLAAQITELKNRKPISVTKTIIQPIEVLKETDNIVVEQDSVFIEDYYPKKENAFLKYNNRFSLKTQKGKSTFKFAPIVLNQVVTKKDNGLYQVDFKGPDFLELKSIDIQTEPMAPQKVDNWGTLVGVEYGQNLETSTNIYGINLYQRYKKIYLGASFNTDNSVKGGIKIEF